MDKQQKVMERINNLLNKTVENGCTVEEAASAAKMAQKLIAKHHVDMREFSESEDVDAETATCSTPWQTTLATTISRRMCCDVIYETIPNTRKRRLTFVGHDTDRKAVIELWDKLVKVCNDGIKIEKRIYKDRYGSARGVAESYARGFIRAIREAMDEQCRALMLVVPEEVNNKVKEIFPEVHTEKPRKLKLWKTAYENGMSAGRDAVGRKMVCQ